MYFHFPYSPNQGCVFLGWHILRILRKSFSLQTLQFSWPEMLSLKIHFIGTFLYEVICMISIKNDTRWLYTLESSAWKIYSNKITEWIEELKTSSYMVWKCHDQKITLNFVNHLHFRVNGYLSFFEGAGSSKIKDKSNYNLLLERRSHKHKKTF